jgi:hypothetical protein
MKSYNKESVKIQELIVWKKNSNINPRTSREISLTGNVYKYLEKEYQKNLVFINKLVDSEKCLIESELKLIDCIDDRDPISMNVFWRYQEGKKVIIYSDESNLILYKDSRGNIRCFEKESLSYLKAYGINKHPVSFEDIPIEILNKVESKNLVEERKTRSNKDFAFEVFQKFLKISIFIDSEWFLNLTKSQLVKFNYELREFYQNNFSEEQKKDISSIEIFTRVEKDLNQLQTEDIIKYLLEQIDVLLNIEKEELKYMSNYILIGALGLVIPEIKEMYPDFAFSF